MGEEKVLLAIHRFRENIRVTNLLDMVTRLALPVFVWAVVLVRWMVPALNFGLPLRCKARAYV